MFLATAFTERQNKESARERMAAENAVGRGVGGRRGDGGEVNRQGGIYSDGAYAKEVR